MIRPLESGDLPAAVAEHAEVTALPSALGGWRVQLRDAEIGATRAAALLSKLCGETFQVLAVLDAEDGSERYPTGAVVVRFAQPIDDDALQAFARRAGVKLARKTKFTDRQAVFSVPARGAASSADALGRVAGAPGVERAWLEAESAYKRAP